MNKKRIFIDTDGAVNDCRNLIIALQQDNVEIVGISTVSGCTTAEQAVANISRTIRANGSQSPGDIPIYKGADHPLGPQNIPNGSMKYFFGPDGIGGLPDNPPAFTKSDYKAADQNKKAANALVEVFGVQKKQIILICTGPLTNIALALRLEAEFAYWPKEVVIMGGNLFGVGNVSASSTAEFNFAFDPEAAQIVLDQIKRPITIIPWECNKFHINIDKVDFYAHLNYDTVLSQYCKTITTDCRKSFSFQKTKFGYIDEITIAVALYPDKAILKDHWLHASVELNGTYTRGQVAVEWKNDPTSRKPLIRFVEKYNAAFVDLLMHHAVTKFGYRS